MDCSYCEFKGTVCDRFFAALEKTCLKSLIFDGNIIGINHLRSFGHSLARVSVLQEMSLKSCGLGNEGVIVIARNLMNKSNLLSLNLQNNRISVYVYFNYCRIKVQLR